MSADINQFFVIESGRITYDIYRRKQYDSPWLTLPRKVAWEGKMGEVLTTVLWNRPFVEVENAWAAMSINDGDGNSCIPPVDDVQFSQKLRETRLYHKAVHSPRFCVTDLLYTAGREKQMEAVQAGLAETVAHYWIDWNRDGFTRNARKVIAEPGLATNDETDGLKFPPVECTSRLTNGICDYFYNLILLEGGARHALSWQNGKPVFGLITDNFTSRFLIRGDDAIREDFRYAAPDKLLAPLGVTHVYNGFVHMIDEAPPRWNFNSGNVETPTDNPATDPWVRVPHYILDETVPTSPEKIVNPAWLTALAQDSFFYVKGAYQLRVPPSVNGVAKADFKPQHYMGDFKWQNVINVDEDSDAYNPDGTIGRFRGVLAAGVEPIAPFVMYVIRHLVCQPELNLVTCPE